VESCAGGKERYDRFLKNAAASMLNGSQAATRDGVEQ